MRRLSDNAALCHRRSHWVEESNVARQPPCASALVSALLLRRRLPADAASLRLRKTRGKVSQPGSPFSPVTSLAAALGVKGSLAPDLRP